VGNLQILWVSNKADGDTFLSVGHIEVGHNCQDVTCGIKFPRSLNLPNNSNETAIEVRCSAAFGRRTRACTSSIFDRLSSPCDRGPGSGDCRGFKGQLHAREQMLWAGCAA